MLKFYENISNAIVILRLIHSRPSPLNTGRLQKHANEDIHHPYEK